MTLSAVKDLNLWSKPGVGGGWGERDGAGGGGRSQRCTLQPPCLSPALGLITWPCGFQGPLWPQPRLDLAHPSASTCRHRKPRSPSLESRALRRFPELREDPPQFTWKAPPHPRHPNTWGQQPHPDLSASAVRSLCPCPQCTTAAVGNPGEHSSPRWPCGP